MGDAGRERGEEEREWGEERSEMGEGTNGEMGGRDSRKKRDG